MLIKDFKKALFKVMFNNSNLFYSPSLVISIKPYCKLLETELNSKFCKFIKLFIPDDFIN